MLLDHEESWLCSFCQDLKCPYLLYRFFQTAALHGNELNGIPLTHRLVLQEIQCQALHGIVVAVPVANVPGYLAQQRGFSDGTDLNRLMPGYGTFSLYTHLIQ